MTNCCGDYHYSDCPTRTGASYDDYDHFEAWVDAYNDAPDPECGGSFDECPWGGCSDCDNDTKASWDAMAEDAAMESALWGDC